MPVALLNAQLGTAHIGSELGAPPKMLFARMACTRWIQTNNRVKVREKETKTK